MESPRWKRRSNWQCFRRLDEYCLNTVVNYDSLHSVTKSNAPFRSPREKLIQAFALAFLLFLGGLAFAGPSGLLAWGDNLKLLDKRKAQITQLEAERDELKNRVALLNPRHADPDLVGELLRSNLNVAHPDEVVIKLN